MFFDHIDGIEKKLDLKIRMRMRTLLSVGAYVRVPINEKSSQIPRHIEHDRSFAIIDFLLRFILSNFLFFFFFFFLVLISIIQKSK